MDIQPFTDQYHIAAAELFVQNFSRLRESVPALPETLADVHLIASKISRLLEGHPGVVALEDGHLVGYLCSMVVGDFRDTGQRGAYCPEWAHAVQPGRQAVAYRRMYRVMGAAWAEQRCLVHAITMLAGDQETLQTWFWGGFGMLAVDAVRPVQPLEREPQTRLSVRRAVIEDAAALAALDVEHCHYYTQSPVFMVLRESQDTGEFAHFLAEPKNSIWLALDGDVPVGFLRLDGYENDGADALTSPETIKINGAFVQAAYRGQGGSSAMLEAALCHHATLGMRCCAVDFEATNPDATAFWLRHFQPVCLSLMRCPETVPGGANQQTG
jgi:GNAT superfamily N-acetyltransferase